MDPVSCTNAFGNYVIAISYTAVARIIIKPRGMRGALVYIKIRIIMVQLYKQFTQALPAVHVCTGPLCKAVTFYINKVAGVATLYF